MNEEKDWKREREGEKKGERKGKGGKDGESRGKSVKKAVGIRNGYGLEKGTDTERRSS